MRIFNYQNRAGHRSALLMAGLVLLTTALVFALSGCEQQTPQSVSATDFALGTTCSVKLFGQKNQQYLEPALDIAGEVEARMSAHTEDSEVARINRNAGNSAAAVSQETFALVARAKEFSQLSEGIFDLSVGPLVELWDIGSGEESVPSPDALSAALEKVDYREVQLIPADESEGSQPKVRLEEAGMRLDLGAIAKGYAADRIVEFLKSRGVGYGIVNLGGNVYAFGQKHNTTKWKIGIQSPDDERGSYIGVIELIDKAVVTSGKYERYFVEDGTRYHHILSTADGYPIENELASVSIVSADATEADALSTLVFGLGLRKGIEFTEQREGIEAILVTEDNTVFTTTGLRTSFELTDKDFKRGESRQLLSLR
ncbi:MAG: FAD:protein FMN transferase [Spirochaetota bacterium]